MKFGDNLKSLRKLKKLSQEDLAEKMNVSRQSVSKWETGDAYPEMNNILELCKIFHCRINDLVNDSIIDIELLDEEVKMNVVKFKKEQQSKMKGLSKTITIIARVMRIICLLCIPIIVATMLIIGVLIMKVNINNNEITFDGTSDKIRIEEKEDKVTVKINDQVAVNSYDALTFKRFIDFVDNNSKFSLIVCSEVGFLTLIAYLVITAIMLAALEKLFININNGDTPFTLENVGYIKKMAYLLIAITIIPGFIGGICEVVFNADLNMGLELYSLVEILFLFSIAYIFEYGYEIQLDSKGKMYGDEDE